MLLADARSPRHDLLFVGFQAPGTPGHAIQKYGPRGGYVDLDGQRLTIRARVASVGGYSAHAGQRDLVNFVARIAKLPGEVRLVHGDEASKRALRSALLELAARRGQNLAVNIGTLQGN